MGYVTESLLTLMPGSDAVLLMSRIKIMLMRENKGLFSVAFDVAHVK